MDLLKKIEELKHRIDKFEQVSGRFKRKYFKQAKKN